MGRIRVAIVCTDQGQFRLFHSDWFDLLNEWLKLHTAVLGVSHDCHHTAALLLLLMMYDPVVFGLENALRSFIAQEELLGAQLFLNWSAVFLRETILVKVMIRHTAKWPINDSIGGSARHRHVVHVLEFRDAAPQNNPAIRLLPLTLEEVTACLVAYEGFVGHPK